jgi:hypothetical protein
MMTTPLIRPQMARRLPAINDAPISEHDRRIG